MHKSDDISMLAAALVKAQPMVEGAKKDAVNPFFKSKYADLASVWDAVRDALEKNGLAVSQLVDETAKGEAALTTMLIHESGQWISATYPLVVAKPDSQAYGSAISYARRYGLAALLGVLADDDDGEAATRPPKPSTKAQQTEPPKQEPPPQSKASMTALQWVEKAQADLGQLRSKPDFTTWLHKNAAAVDKLHDTNRALYNALSLKIQLRSDELERAA